MPPRTLLLALGAAGLALALFVVASPGAPPQASAAPPEATPEATPEAAAPSAQNVDPGVHGELMRLRAAAEAAPDDVAAQLAFAEMALGAHRGADAAEALERVVAREPERRQAWLDLANAYGAASDWDAVADASRRLLARHPGDAEASYNLGAAHANAGRSDDARAVWARLAGSDGAMAAQAQSSLARLDAMGAAPAAAQAAAAPPLSDPSAALPADHPPIPPGHPPIPAATREASAWTAACAGGSCAEGGSCGGTCAEGDGCGCGVETRVVEAGRADPATVRALASTLGARE